MGNTSSVHSAAGANDPRAECIERLTSDDNRGVYRSIGDVVVPAGSVEKISQRVIVYRRAAEAEAAGDDQATIGIGKCVAEWNFYYLALVRVRTVGERSAVVRTVERARSGIDQPARFAVVHRFCVGEVHRPLDRSVRERQFTVAVVIEKSPKPKALRLTSDAALEVFVLSIGRRRRRCRKRQLGTQIPFRAVADASDADCRHDFHGFQIRHDDVLLRRAAALPKW